METKQFHILVGEKNLGRVQDWIKTADQKAGFTLTITLALFGVSLSTINPAVNIIIESISRGQAYWILVGTVCIVYSAYIIFACCAIWLLIEVVRPRIIPTTNRKSPLFFGSISEMEIASFKKNMISLDYENFIEEISDQTYIASEIAVIKYKNLNLAFEKLIYVVITGLLSIGLTSVSSALLFP